MFEILFAILLATLVVAIAVYFWFVFDYEILHGYTAKKLRAYLGVAEK